jgi:hypothetical protein
MQLDLLTSGSTLGEGPRPLDLEVVGTVNAEQVGKSETCVSFGVSLSTSSFVQQRIMLKAAIPIMGGREIGLPIEVPPNLISLNGSAPPKVVSVTSNVADGVYGAGQVRHTSRPCASITWP